MLRKIVAISLTAALAGASLAGPTPVPSVPPGTMVGQVPVADGRWMGIGERLFGTAQSSQAYVMFDVRNHEIQNLRFVGFDFYCTYSDGTTQNFPFTMSHAGSSDAMNIVRLDQSGHAQTMIQVSDTGHWLRVSLVTRLNNKTGYISMSARNIPGPDGIAPKDQCRLYFERTNVKWVSASSSAPAPTCGGYPWDPPECTRPRN